ncbi:transposase (plasmid) [Cylindrospermum sp. NIES-4074]|nr:transposase [Cylindrospermum sp. NIES-4074]
MNPNHFQVWFWDESGFSLRVLRRKTWGKKGQRKKVTGQRSRGRVNIMGGLRLCDKKRLCYFVDKGNGETFYEQLKQLYEFVRQEWIANGYSSEDFCSFDDTSSGQCSSRFKVLLPAKVIDPCSELITFPTASENIGS